MIDYICVPAEIIDCVNYYIVDDHCLNVSRHRPIIAQLTLLCIESSSLLINEKCNNWKKG